MTTKKGAKKKRRNLVPEFDLPPILLETFAEYVGPRRLAKLTSEQRAFLTGIASRAAVDVGEVFAGTYQRPDRTHATLRIEELERELHGTADELVGES